MFLLRRTSKGHSLARAWVFGVALLGAYVFLTQVEPHYAPKTWLFWTLAKLWGWLAVFSLASLCFGQLLLVRVFRLTALPALESATLAMAAGTVAFVMGMYAGGACALYGPAFAVLLPCAMMVAGLRDGISVLSRCSAELRSARPGWFSMAAAGFGAVGLFLVYLGSMTPDAICPDATMVHLRIAEEYARVGRLVPFPTNHEAAVPHLASLLYAWGQMVPGLSLAERWMQALHLEFCLFAWTLVGVGAAVQRMVGDFGLRGSWAVVFLFPGFYLSDSNLGASADHVLGFFAVPVALATVHACDGFRRGPCSLLAGLVGGTVLTKYQAIYLLGGVALIIAGVWLRALYRDLRGKPLVLQTRANLLWAPLIMIGVGILVVAPHFIKNAVFHHNPFYPFMQETFTRSWPTYAEAPFYVENMFKAKDYTPQGTFPEQLWHATKLFFRFSFQPHYAGPQPHFGSLFTLLLPTLLFGAGRRKIVPFAVMASSALFVWALIFNVDRNLQAFMPLLSAVTAALVIRAWRLGALPRAGLVPLVGLQLLWAADMPFLEGRSRITSAMTLIASGRDGKAEGRLARFRAGAVALDDALPPNAKVLSHLSYDTVGISREVLLDRMGFQSLIDYRSVRSVRGLYDLYRSLGITHVLYDSAEAYPDSQQDEILLAALTRRYSTDIGTFGNFHVYELPAAPPPAQASFHVLVVGITGYRDGLYPIESLTTVEGLPPTLRKYAPPEVAVSEASPPEELAKRADAVLTRGSTRGNELGPVLQQDFDWIMSFGGGNALHLRRP